MIKIIVTHLPEGGYQKANRYTLIVGKDSIIIYEYLQSNSL